MKVLLISNFFPPTHMAGTEKRTLGYSLQLKERGHKVQVLCAGIWEDDLIYWKGHTDEIFQGINVRRINLNWSLAPDPNQFLFRNPNVEEHLRKWLLEVKPDIVHITSCNTLSASVIQAAKAQDLPVVLTLTDFWFICPRVTLLKADGSLCDGRTTSWDCLECMLADTRTFRAANTVLPERIASTTFTFLSRRAGFRRIRSYRGKVFDMEDRKAYLSRMMHLADCMIAPSTYVRDAVQAGTAQNIRVIHSGQDLGWLDSTFEKKPSKKIRIGFIGQVTPIKGVDVLVRAFLEANIAERAHLSIHGDGDKFPEYTKELQGLRSVCPTAIKFHGAFPHEELGDVLSEIDILVVPSRWHENNPRVVQEAFATKTPVIGSDVRGLSEFVKHDVNGLLFERDNTDQLAHHLRRLVEQPELLNQLSKGVGPVKTMEEEVAELEGIYEDLLRAFSH
jgi:glycosyltransferase involved in cell wall biosynthesis